MSSSIISSPSSGKISIPSISANYSQGPSTTSGENFQKRSNNSGNSGAGSQTRHSPSARNNQSIRKQNKTQRRARLADDDTIAENAAMRSINSRKGQTSITHLMNFTLPPRPYQQHQSFQNHRNQRRNPTWGLGSGYHAVDKARYVHANYRFIVRPDSTYEIQASDADVHLSWDKVLQILASSDTQSASCPICLSTPVAPRMARCGHMFCLPCLIRYMHSTDDVNPTPEKRARWKKCPICEDSVYVSETRPVRWFIGQEASMLQEGGDVLLRLLMREPGTTLALPRDAAEAYGRQDDIPWFHVAEIMDYARFMKGGEDYMIEQFDKEIYELEEQEKEDELVYGDDTTWVRRAVIAIEELKQKIKGIGNPPQTKPTNTDNQPEAPEYWDQPSSPDEPTVATSSLSSAIERISLQPPTLQDKPSTRSSTHRRSHPFYFYHALPNFFLSPLDIRILKTAFGDFSSFPSTILPRVEHISTGHVVDDDLRKRAKYIAHLPYGCEVSFLECDWVDIISPSVLDQFKDDISRRQHRNHDKEAREERDRIRAEKQEEEQRYAAYRRRRPSSIAKSFSETDFQPLAPQGASSPDDVGFATTPPWANHRSHSFATLASPGTSPDAPRTVWGTTAIVPTSPSIPTVVEQHPVDDGWLQGWEKDLLDESDAVAMVEASLVNEGSTRSSVQTNNKKGKKKKITLMSTNVRRGA